MMTSRLDRALTKLYKAFHNDELHPECCRKCAVGNICDNTDTWKHLTEIHGSLKLSYVGLVNQKFGRRIHGYTPFELLQIEAEFLKGCGYSGPIDRKCIKPDNPTDKENLFNGLCSVVSYLCRLDNIPNVMEYQKLFEVENDKPKYELSMV